MIFWHLFPHGWTLENNIINERNKTQKNKCCMTLLLWAKNRQIHPKKKGGWLDLGEGNRELFFFNIFYCCSSTVFCLSPLPTTPALLPSLPGFLRPLLLSTCPLGNRELLRNCAEFLFRMMTNSGIVVMVAQHYDWNIAIESYPTKCLKWKVSFYG